MPLPTPTVTEQYDRRELTDEEDGTVSGARVWTIEYPDPDGWTGVTAGELAAIDSHARSFVPVARFSPHPGEPTALARSMSLSNAGGIHLWTAAVRYSSRFDAEAAQAAELQTDGLDTATAGAASSPAGGDGGQEAEARPYTVRSIKRTEQVPLEFDAITGRRVTNTAGDPFDPPPMTEKTFLGYEITFYRYPANLRWADTVSAPFGRPQYQDTLNNAAFKIFKRTHAARELRVSDVSFALSWDKGAGGALTPVVEVKVELLHKPGGWKRDLLSRGYQAFIGGGIKRQLLDAAGQPVTEPQPLDENGYRLAAGGALVYVRTWEYPERNLRELFL